MDEMKDVERALKEEDRIATREAKRMDRAFEKRDNSELENLAESEAEADEMLTEGTYDAEAKAENFEEFMAEDKKIEARSVKNLYKAFDEAANESERKSNLKKDSE